MPSAGQPLSDRFDARALAGDLDVVARGAQADDGGDGLAFVDQSTIGLVDLLLAGPGWANVFGRHDLGAATPARSGHFGPVRLLLVDGGKGHPPGGSADLIGDLDVRGDVVGAARGDDEVRAGRAEWCDQQDSNEQGDDQQVAQQRTQS